MAGERDAVGMLAWLRYLQADVAAFIAIPSQTQQDYDDQKLAVTKFQQMMGDFVDPNGYGACYFDPPFPDQLADAVDALTNLINDLETYAGNNSLTP